MQKKLIKLSEAEIKCKINEQKWKVRINCPKTGLQ